MKKWFASFLLALIFLMPISLAIADSVDTQISHGNDDLYAWETGQVYKDSNLVFVRFDFALTSYFRFRNITGPEAYDHINNATLQFHTKYNYQDDLPWDPASIITIWGIDVSDLEPFGNFSDLNSMPYTSASVAWNVSQMKGANQWHSVEVTNIVQEIINRWGWRSGNDIGFQILATPGIARQVMAYDWNPSLSARLNITYEVGDSPDPDLQKDSGFNESDGYNWDWWQSYLCYDVWNVSIPAQDWDYILMQTGGPNTSYSRPGNGTQYLVNDSSYEMGQNLLTLDRDSFGNLWFINRIERQVDNGTKYDKDHLELWRSTDNGVTWAEFADLVDIYNGSGAFAYDQGMASIWIDENSRIWIYVCWAEDGHAQRGVRETWYQIENNTWRPTLSAYLSDDINANNTIDPVPWIEIDRGRRQLVYGARNGSFAKTQIWFKEYSGGSWSTSLRVTDDDIDNYLDCQVATGYPNGSAIQRTMIVYQKSTGGGLRYIYSKMWNGSGLGAQKNVYSGGTVNQQPTLLLGPNNQRFYCVWIRFYAPDFRVRFARYQYVISSWAGQMTASHNDALNWNQATASIDGADNIMIVYAENDALPYNVHYRERLFNGSWLPQNKEAFNSASAFTYSNLDRYVGNASIYYVIEKWDEYHSGTTSLDQVDLVLTTEPCNETGPPIPPDIPTPTGWPDPSTGSYFTRFRFRMYVIILGLFLVFGPVWYMAYSKPPAFQVAIGLVIMLIGLGFLIGVPYI